MSIIYCSFAAQVVPTWFHNLENTKSSGNLFHPARPLNESVLNALKNKTVDHSFGLLLKNEALSKPVEEVKEQFLHNDRVTYLDTYEFKAFYIMARADLVIADFNYPFGFEDNGVELMVAWLLNKRIIGVSNALNLNPFLANRCSMIVKANSEVLLEEVAKLQTT